MVTRRILRGMYGRPWIFSTLSAVQSRYYGLSIDSEGLTRLYY